MSLADLLRSMFSTHFVTKIQDFTQVNQTLLEKELWILGLSLLTQI